MLIIKTTPVEPCPNFLVIGDTITKLLRSVPGPQKRLAGYSFFGVQYAGECSSGPQAYMTYKKYGSSNRCVNGWGGDWAQNVYEIVSK